MSSAPVVDRIRIVPRPGDFLGRYTGSSGEVFYNRETNSLRVYSGKDQSGFEIARADLANVNTSQFAINPNIASVKFNVTVINTGEGNKYVLNGDYWPELNFVVGYTYIFNQTDPTNVYYPNPTGGTNNQHPLNFSADNINGELDGGTVYTENVTYKLDNTVVTKQQYWSGFESASQRSVEILVTSNTPSTLYYWCQNHLNMGRSISVAIPGSGTGQNNIDIGASVDVSADVPTDPANGNLWLDTNTGRLYIYIDDGDSEQWIQPAVPVFSGDYNDLINRPVLATVATSGSYTDLTGIPTDVQLSTLSQGGAIDGQLLAWNGTSSSWQPTDFSSVSTGNFIFSGSVIGTDDSSGITITPLLTAQSDLLVENDLVVRNKIEAQSVSAEQFVNNGVGASVLESGSTLTLDAVDVITLRSPEGVVVDGGAFRLPSLTTTERNNITAANGDVIYNTTDNKIQAYQNSAWINLDGT